MEIPADSITLDAEQAVNFRSYIYCIHGIMEQVQYQAAVLTFDRIV